MESKSFENNTNIQNIESSLELTSLNDNIANEHLISMGYVPEMRRKMSTWSLLGAGFSITNSWLACAVFLALSIYSGGPLMPIYGIIIGAFFGLCTGISLGELASAYPTSSGQYYWTIVLAPKKYAPFLSYLCGSLTWAGSIFCNAATSMLTAQMIVSVHALLAGPDFEIKNWMIFITFQLCNVASFLFSCIGKLLPTYATLALYISLISFAVTLVTVLSKSSGNFNSSKFIFVEFNNQTGWSSSAIAFIVGLINPAAAFGFLDSATHLAEECIEPEVIIPKAIMFTVAVGFVTALSYTIGICFCITDLDTILSSNTGMPILDIFYLALKNKGGAILLMVMLITSVFFAFIMVQSYASRISWSFSRDNGLLGSRYWRQIHPQLGVPLNAGIMITLWTAACGCLYMASSAGFSSLISGAVLFMMLSYIVPIICMLIRGRNSFKHGPFWLNSVGYAANVLTIFWTIFCLVFFCFPFSKPVTKDNMNYISVILVGFTAWCVIYWIFRGRKVFSTADMHQTGFEELDGEAIKVEAIVHEKTVRDNSSM
ncbi:uncharacterized protein SAPINGB_P001221 [Magnusiomyces paraingens]|uniref:Choline transport protein n=1 Tax=Magnusiomyces paraingens TaxID=2606893 RepID=A0A5E8BAV0_9ASCO|nr:uncharacterized protein SAPINGB_P001221 [Saprochaete ingens]VVT46453.1 unnamed protein product [Saprochaete ingens]